MGMLNGENIKPLTNKDAKKLVGNKVNYLRSCDIDKSGRGYFFPRKGTITSVFGRNIEFNNGDFVCIRDIVEMILIEVQL